MLDAPAFVGNRKILCEMGGKNPEMLMNIYVERLRKGARLDFLDGRCETAVLLLKGEVRFSWEGSSVVGKRQNPFERKPYCVHFARNAKVGIEALEDSEVIVQQTTNDREFPTAFHSPEDCLYQEFGKGQWGGTGHRIVSTMFDLDNAPTSNMVMGEVFNQPGKWSSYPPHHHPQPELYYYQFDRPEGFGASFIGDEVFKSVDGSYAAITGGHAHQQVVAPGFTMYYVWLIRHLDGDPWDKTRIYIKEYEWLASAK
jgi:5-deoxy-glucuronate isomerase